MNILHSHVSFKDLTKDFTLTIFSPASVYYLQNKSLLTFLGQINTS